MENLAGTQDENQDRASAGREQAEGLTKPRNDLGARPAATGFPGHRLGPGVDSHPSVGPVQGCRGRRLPLQHACGHNYSPHPSTTSKTRDGRRG